MVDPAFTSRSTLNLDLDMIEAAVPHAPPMSHLPPALHSPSHTHGPHSLESLADQFAMSTGHGLLGGKVRKPVAYPHAFSAPEGVSDVYYKKGK